MNKRVTFISDDTIEKIILILQELNLGELHIEEINLNSAPKPQAKGK